MRTAMLLAALLLSSSGFASGCSAHTSSAPAGDQAGGLPPAGALDPAPDLPSVAVYRGGEGECPQAFALCMDEANASRLELRMATLERWVRRACARWGCGKPAAATVPPPPDGGTD